MSKLNINHISKTPRWNSVAEDTVLDRYFLPLPHTLHVTLEKIPKLI